MLDPSDVDCVNAMVAAQSGSVPVSYGGRDGSGHKGLPAGMAFEDPEMMMGKPSVVVAAGYFPSIGVDEVDGLDGIVDTEISVGDHVYAIARAMAVSEDGGEILLLLTDPN